MKNLRRCVNLIVNFSVNYIIDIRMNKKVLNLDEVVDEIIRVLYPTYEQAIPGMKSAMIQKKRQVRQILEYHIKSACEFYLRYRNNPDLFEKEMPSYKDDVSELRGGWYDWDEYYDKWIFKLAFGAIWEIE